MLKVSGESIAAQTKDYYEQFKKAGITIDEEKFIKVFVEHSSTKPRTYPYTIKVPKDVFSMLRGDFEPAQEITITEPIIGCYGEMWNGDSSKIVNLSMGCINGDIRKPFVDGLGDALVHGLMAGATGTGKSVALNSIIYGMCYKYAPWAVKLTLADGKIVTFKNLATLRPLPQVEVVAATGDADYLISVLEYRLREMEATQKMFTVAGKHFGGVTIENIMQFNEVTGLTLPRNMIIFDEFQALFQGAGKKTKRIVEILDLFGRLGRATGFHLFMCSQEIGSDIPQGLLNNMSFRAALGCDPPVSEKVIGNDAAKFNKGQKGQLIVNTKAVMQSASDNIDIKVPWCKNEDTDEIFKSTKEKASQFDINTQLKFYDEEAVRHTASFQEFVNSFAVKDRIILGDPAFLMSDEEQMVSIDFEGSGIENVAVVSKDMLDIKRSAQTIAYNLVRQKCSCIGLCTDAGLMSILRTVCPQYLYDDRGFDGTFFKLMHRTIYKRLLAIEIDKRVFSNESFGDIDSLFNDSLVASFTNNTEIYKKRYFAFKALLKSDAVFSKEFGGYSEEAEAQLFKEIHSMWESYGCATSQIRSSMFGVVYFLLGNAESIVGIGIDAKSQNLNKLKKMLLDCCIVNVRVIMFTTTFAEFSDLKSAFKFYVFDRPMTADLSRTGCRDTYPETVLPVLACLWNAMRADEIQKYKKLYFDGEI